MDTTTWWRPPPADPGASWREQRLAQLGLGGEPIPEFDAVAVDLGRAVRTQFAMVNFIGQDGQRFPGLYEEPDVPQGVRETAALLTRTPVGREMARGYGFCEDVITRPPFTALVLRDVRLYPRCKSNPVVSVLGVHSYVGVTVLDPDFPDRPIATVCGVSTDPRPDWTMDVVDIVKSASVEVTNIIRSIQPRR